MWSPLREIRMKRILRNFGIIVLVSVVSAASTAAIYDNGTPAGAQSFVDSDVGGADILGEFTAAQPVPVDNANAGQDNLYHIDIGFGPASQLEELLAAADDPLDAGCGGSYFDETSDFTDAYTTMVGGAGSDLEGYFYPVSNIAAEHSLVQSVGGRADDSQNATTVISITASRDGFQQRLTGRRSDAASTAGGSFAESTA